MKKTLKNILLLTLLGTSCQSSVYAATGITSFGIKMKEKISAKITAFKKKSALAKVGATLSLLIFPGDQLYYAYLTRKADRNPQYLADFSDKNLDDETARELKDTIRQAGMDPDTVTLYPKEGGLVTLSSNWRE